MDVCDICTTHTPVRENLVSSIDFKTAVLVNGFDPFKMKIASPTSKFWNFGNEAFNMWKSMVVIPDNSAWNLCRNCFSHYRQFVSNNKRETIIMNCSFCNGKISRKAPIVSTEGKEIAYKYNMGFINDEEMDGFYKAIGSECSNCGKMVCALCYHDKGEKCPHCKSPIKFFV
jgi:hypothetical protein